MVNYMRALAGRIGHYTKLADMSMKILRYSIEENDPEINWKVMGEDKSDIVDMYNKVMKKKKGIKGNLQENFLAPPFTILDTKQQYWVERKNIWLSKGLKGELGRELEVGGQYRTSYGQLEKDKGSATGGYKVNGKTAVSPFDPVLSELNYYWFCTNKNRKILDPFAGGPSRGVVAEYIGFNYTGIELREEQVIANKENSKIFGVEPNWIIGDSNIIIDSLNKEYDMIFTCPPYYNLEVYSKLNGELSSASSYQQFIDMYSSILHKSVSKLKDDRFACIVIENIRDKKTGKILNLVGDTISIMENCGMIFYNDIILSTPIGSAPTRSGNHMREGRKVERVHQNVLVFFKGNPKNIKNNYGKIKLRDIK